MTGHGHHSVRLLLLVLRAAASALWGLTLEAAHVLWAGNSNSEKGRRLLVSPNKVTRQ